jgi:hypothetical protein
MLGKCAHHFKKKLKPTRILHYQWIIYQELSRIIYGYFICLTKQIFGKEGSLYSKMKSSFSSSEIAYFKLPCHIWYDAKVLS